MHAEIVVRLQILHNHVGEVMNIDDYFCDSRGAEARKSDLEQGVAGDFDQRLRAIVSERA